jgi:isopenicillin-N N-acyltransferase like protein
VRERLRQVALASLLLAATPCWGDDAPAPPVRKLIAAEGKGYLETVDGYRVLHLKGTPEEMGRQHGVLLKSAIRTNVEFLLGEGVDETVKIGPLTLQRKHIARFLNASFNGKIPARFLNEMKALAKGADLPEWKVTAANLIPELMHCSGFALLADATAEGKLLHGRVLDYGVKLKLQDHAVLILQEPDGRIGFANVSYAGFVGSVTGMNAEQVSIGEMGGGGVGHWNGVPMSFLVRTVLENAKTLDDAIAVFRDNPRTCEYYYVIADAKCDSAVGMKAVPDAVELVKPGEVHKLLPHPVKNTVLLSAGERYESLSRLVAKGYGRFTQAKAIRLMDKPVAMDSNLHNALMVPGEGVLWIANAGPRGEPAWKQRYYRFNIRKLMASRPPAAKDAKSTPR